MFLLVTVLNYEEKLNQVLEGFLDIGIKGATVLESTGMGQSILDCEIPVVSGLRKLLFTKTRAHNVTIFSVVSSEEKVQEAIKTVENVVGELGNPGTGIVFAFPLEVVKGVME